MSVFTYVLYPIFVKFHCQFKSAYDIYYLNNCTTKLISLSSLLNLTYLDVVMFEWSGWCCLGKRRFRRRHDVPESLGLIHNHQQRGAGGLAGVVLGSDRESPSILVKHLRDEERVSVTHGRDLVVGGHHGLVVEVPVDLQQKKREDVK